MVVQLGSLAMFNWLCPGHYLLATAEALELTLMRNFFLGDGWAFADAQKVMPRFARISEERD